MQGAPSNPLLGTVPAWGADECSDPKCPIGMRHKHVEDGEAVAVAGGMGEPMQNVELRAIRQRAQLEVAVLQPLSEFAGEAAGICLARDAVMPTAELMAAAQRAATRVADIVEAALLVGLERAPEHASDARLGRDLLAILQCHCGERGNSEGAVETLHRIVLERERAERKLAELDPEIVRRVSAEMRRSK